MQLPLRTSGVATGVMRDVDPAFLAWDRAGPYVTGGVIVAVAVYR
jgi:hypothetical protein